MDSLDQPIKISPRIWPRGLPDLLITTVVTVPLLVVFFAPFTVVLLASESAAAAMILLVAQYVALLLFSVWSLTLSTTGIRFRRVLGSPKELPWARVQSVLPASRAEVILKGWFGLPPKELTACLSTQGHYRINWPEGYCYFAPADAIAFESYVLSYVPRRGT